MAHGDNHAKQIVVGQAKDLAEKLANGSGADPATQGQAIGLLVQMVSPLYEAEFVTTEICAATRTLCAERVEEKHQEILEKIDYAVEMSQNGDKNSKNNGATMNLGPLSLKGPVVPIFVVLAVLMVPTAAVVFIMGKNQGWW